MTFPEKISTILRLNKLGIATSEDLSEYCGFHRDTIRKAIDRGSELNPGNTRILKDKLNINPDWWETGKGEVFLKNGTPASEPAINKNLPYNEEREILIRTIDRMGTYIEYLLRDKGTSG